MLNGSSQHCACTRVRTLISVAAVLLCACLLLTGCSANSTLNVNVQDNASGTIKLTLVLDEEASSIIRTDTYDASSLSAVFDIPTLRKAGYKVDVVDTNKKSRIDLSTSFENEGQLRSALAVLAPSEVVNATLMAKHNLLKEQHAAKLTVDVPKLRALYLDDSDVKNAVAKAGIEFSEFKTLVNKAFSSTRLTFSVSHNSDKVSKTISGTTKSKSSVALARENIRTQYLLNMAGAIVCAVIALVLLWRLCRTPRLLSKNAPKSTDNSEWPGME